MAEQLFKIEFYVPESHLEQVKMALFQAGAGRVGNYDCCAWQTKGLGQFRPGAASSPYLGQSGRVESVDEFKVELVCDEPLLPAAIKALLAYHPYEEPAYSVFRMEAY